MRTDKEVLLATRPFARELRWLSWWHLGSTLLVLAALTGVACCEMPWPLRVPFSLLAGLTIVRLFVLYHDHQHGTILRGSKVADCVMAITGLMTLCPPSVWKRSHDHHHFNNSKSFGANVGSYPLITAEAYACATRRERLAYTASRHPLTIAAGYVTVFFYGMCVAPLLANPRRHLDAVLSVACHAGVMAWFAVDEVDDLWLAGIVPFAFGSAVGSYLFFAQHNFPGARLQVGKEWSYVSAALRSSSFIRMGPVMRWFTANIGYHHVHHLNAHIPFYRLPEAMRAVPELQSPTTTSLTPRDIASCLRLKVWDSAAGCLAPWPTVRPGPIGYETL